MVAELGYSRPARLDRVSLFVSITGDSAIAVVLLTDVGSMLITQTQALEAASYFLLRDDHACLPPSATTKQLRCRFGKPPDATETGPPGQRSCIGRAARPGTATPDGARPAARQAASYAEMLL